MMRLSTKFTLVIGLLAATLALSTSMPGTSLTGFTSTAIASEGGEDMFARMKARGGKKSNIKKRKKGKSAAQKRAERKRKAAARKKARDKAKAVAKAKAKAKYRKMTGKNLEVGMPSDKNFGSLKGSLGRDIDGAKTRKAKAKVARKYARIYNTRAKQVQNRSVKLANKYRSFAGKLSRYANAQSK